MGQIIKLSTPEQRQKIHAILYKKNLLKHKSEMIEGVTNERSSSSTDLTYDEAETLLASLNGTTFENRQNPDSKLMSKLFAMAHEIGWVQEKTVLNVEKNVLEKKKDYTLVHEWVEQFGYLKKKLRRYAYNELPKLVSQFEAGPYKFYIDNISKHTAK